MALLSGKSCALLLAFVAAVYIQLYQAHDIPDRCYCHEFITFIKANISDFQVHERRSGCDRTELILTLQAADNTTEEICMNTEKRMAKAFLKCWERINKDESRKRECTDRMRRAD